MLKIQSSDATLIFSKHNIIKGSLRKSFKQISYVGLQVKYRKMRWTRHLALVRDKKCIQSVD
jgi:hypothetical protein